MDELSREEFEEYLERKFENIETTTEGWKMVLEGDVNTYRLSVVWDEDGITFRVSPFGFAPTNPTCAANLHRYLLNINAQVSGACFGIDSEGRPLIRTRVPHCNLTETIVSNVFETLLFHAERHYLNVLNLARNEHAEIELPE